MVGFVDDSTGQVNEFLSNQQPTPSALTKKMQHDAQLWSDLLWVSGGNLSWTNVPTIIYILTFIRLELHIYVHYKLVPRLS